MDAQNPLETIHSTPPTVDSSTESHMSAVHHTKEVAVPVEVRHAKLLSALSITSLEGTKEVPTLASVLKGAHEGVVAAQTVETKVVEAVPTEKTVDAPKVVAEDLSADTNEELQETIAHQMAMIKKFPNSAAKFQVRIDSRQKELAKRGMAAPTEPVAAEIPKTALAEHLAAIPKPAETTVDAEQAFKDAQSKLDKLKDRAQDSTTNTQKENAALVANAQTEKLAAQAKLAEQNAKLDSMPTVKKAEVQEENDPIKLEGDVNDISKKLRDLLNQNRNIKDLTPEQQKQSGEGLFSEPLKQVARLLAGAEKTNNQAAIVMFRKGFIKEAGRQLATLDYKISVGDLSKKAANEDIPTRKAA